MRVLIFGFLVLAISFCSHNDDIPTGNSKPIQTQKASFNRVYDITIHNIDSLLGEADAAILEFYSPSCGYCLRMDSIVNSLPKRYEGKVLIGKIDDSNKIADPLFDSFGVYATPTFHYYKNALLKDTVIGAVPVETLDSVLHHMMN